MNNIILYLGVAGFLYLLLTRGLYYIYMLFLNKNKDILDNKSNKIKEEIRDLSKELDNNKRPIVKDKTPKEIEDEWNKK